MITWDILTAIKTALADITGANGYQTDAGLSVSLERLDVHEDTASMLVWMDDLSANQDAASSLAKREMSVRIEATAPALDDRAVETAHALLDDIEKALTKQTCLAPAGVSAVRLTQASITPRSEGSEAVIAAWSCSITYRRMT